MERVLADPQKRITKSSVFIIFIQSYPTFKYCFHYLLLYSCLLSNQSFQQNENHLECMTVKSKQSAIQWNTMESDDKHILINHSNNLQQKS